MARRLFPIRLLMAASTAVLVLSCEKKAEQASSVPESAKEKAAPLPASPPAPAPLPPLRIATVDMARIFKESNRTATANREHQEAMVKVQQENQKRLERIRQLETELETIHKILADPAISDAKRQSALSDRTMKLQDGVALDRERREFMLRKEQALREQAGSKIRGIVEEIRVVVKDLAREENFDYVFDSSAATGNQIPFVISSGSTQTDLSSQIIEQLNRDVALPLEAKGAASTEPAAQATKDQ